MSLYRTHRPKTFEEVVGQAHVTEPIRRQIERDTLAHAYLFSGPRGVGKTTTARLIARVANCTDRKGAVACGVCDSCKAIEEGGALDVIEIDAASHTGVDHVREHIIENIRFAPNQLQKKVFIIDEVHMLSKGAFNALLKTLEEPPAYALFVLATTEIHKIPETIISRCQRFDFLKIPVDVIVERLTLLAEREKVKVDQAVLEEVARHADGCLRDAESLFGQVLALDAKNITVETAAAVLPMMDVSLLFKLMQAIAQKDIKLGLHAIQDAVASGANLGKLTDAWTELARALLLQRMSQEQLQGPYTKEQIEQAMTIGASLSTQQLKVLIDLLLAAREQLGRYHVPQLPLELILVELCGPPAVSDGPGAQAVMEPNIHAENVTPVVVKDKGPEPAKAVNVEESMSESVPEPKTVDEGDVSLDRLQKIWPTFMKALRDRHASLPLALELSEPIRIEGATVTVKVQFEFYAETVNQAKNNALLSSVLSEVTGRSLGIQGAFNNVKEEKNVSAILDAFGGEVVAT